MDEWLAPTFNKHAQKIWKKNKCKRMVRIIGKKTDKSYDRDGGAVAICLFQDNTDKEQEEKERLKSEREERIEKNKEWRQRRQGVKNGTSTKEPLIVDKDARNEQIQNMMVCVNCGEIPEDTVWTCAQAHLLCGDCVDLEEVEQNLLEDRKLGSESGIEEDMLRQEDRESESCTISDGGSYVRPSLNKIDFFENTLNIRKDAITPYEDYNALEDDETNNDLSFNSAGSRSTVREEGENYNKYLQEECPPPYASPSIEEECLKPATLEVTLKTLDETEADPTTWKQKIERNKREIDFFENTLDVRKNTIESYSDYKKVPFESCSQSDSEEEEDNDSEDDTLSPDSSDEDDESVGQVSICPECGDKNLRRNAKLERIVELFNKMMEYRKLL